MYEILEGKLAVHGFDFDPKTYKLRYDNNTIDEYGSQAENYGFIKDWKLLKTGEFFNKDWIVLDCRGLRDEGPSPKSWYKTLITQGNQIKNNGYPVVCCCSAGQSRSSAIAVALLVHSFSMEFYQALELVKEKNPLCLIAPQHISTLKKIFKVKDYIGP